MSSEKPLLSSADDNNKQQYSSKLIKFLIGHHKQVGLFANLLLSLGFTLLLCFEIYDVKDRARETTSIILYFCSFSILVLSGVIEFAIDIYCVRSTGSGRYYSRSTKWNRGISLLFITAMVLNIIAITLWLKFLFQAEKICLLCSSYLFMIMSMIAIYFQIQDMLMKNWLVDTSNKLNFISNVIVVIIAILGLISSHLDISYNSTTDDGVDGIDTIDIIHLIVVPGGLLSALIYAIADLCRVSLHR